MDTRDPALHVGVELKSWRRPRIGLTTTAAMAVVETFFSIEVRDMNRATAFYVDALGATATYPSAGWSSLHIAGVRVGLALSPEHAGGRTGLHFAVTDLAAARRDIARAGGKSPTEPVEVAPGVVIVDVVDTEGNTFTLTQR